MLPCCVDSSTLEQHALESAANAILNGDVENSIFQALSTWQSLRLEFSKRCSLDASYNDSLHLEWACAAMRLITIACARSSEYQAMALESAIYKPIMSIATDPDPDKLGKDVLIRRSIVTISNMVTRNQNVAKHLFPLGLETLPFKQLLKDKSTREPCLVFLLNAIHADEAQLELLGRSSSLLNDLLGLTAEKGAQNGEYAENPLVSAIFSRLFEVGLSERVLQSIEEYELASRNATCRLWKFIKDACTEEKLPQCSGTTLLSTTVKHLGRQLSNLEARQATTEEQVVDQCWQILAYQAGSLAAMLSDETYRECFSDELAHQAITFVVHLLGLAHIHFPRTAGGRVNLQHASPVQANLKRDCVAVIMNLAYKNTAIQDLVRTTGGLALVLAQCNIDDSNPYIKEYATVCMRVLLERNKENQAEVESMAPLSTQQTAELEELGLRSRLTENNKVELEQLVNITASKLHITSINENEYD